MRLLLLLLALPLVKVPAQADARYQHALGLAARQAEVDAREAIPTARSILLTHGRRTGRAVVLFHGLTNSPWQWRAMAQELYAGGANVYVPRLPRHGVPSSDVRSLALLTEADLARSGAQGADVGLGLGDTVTVVGLSAGGNVAAWVAQHRSVTQVVLIAPALAIAGIPDLLATPIREIAARAPDIWHRDSVTGSTRDKTPGWTTRGIAEMLRLAASVRASAERGAPATSRVALLVNAHDVTVLTPPALALLHLWGAHGARVVAYQFPDSLHLPHDDIDPRETGADTAHVYPELRHLLRGTPPDPWMARLRP